MRDSDDHFPDHSSQAEQASVDHSLPSIPEDQDYGDSPRRRRSRDHAPTIPDVVANYANTGVRHEDKDIRVNTLFDAHGRPNIALSVEIAPQTDHPYSFLMRFCESFAHRSLRGDIVWPLNVRNNPYLFYRVGMRKRYWFNDLFIILTVGLMPLLYLTLNITGYYFNIPPIIDLSWLLISFTSILVIGGFMRFFSSDILDDFNFQSACEQIVLTRLTASDLTWAYLSRLMSPFMMGALLSVFTSIITCMIAFTAYSLFGDILSLRAAFVAKTFFHMYLWAIYLYGLFVMSLAIGVMVFHRTLARYVVEIPKRNTTGVHRIKNLDAQVLIMVMVFMFLASFQFFSFLMLLGFFFAFYAVARLHTTCIQVITWHIEKPVGEFLFGNNDERLIQQEKDRQNVYRKRRKYASRY